VTGHWQITIAGATGLGFSWPAVTRVANADILVDGHETTIGAFLTLFPDKAGGYDPRHHFDHPVAERDLTAFAKARAYVLDQEKATVIQDLSTGNCDQVGDALDALGRALHAIQDVYSHSNYVDLLYGAPGLTPAEQATLDAAVLDSSIAPPPDLKLTLYDYALLPENPTGACTADNPAVYCHEYWAKDFAGKNPISGSLNKDYSVYVAASQAAQNETARFIQNIIAAVGQSSWNTLVGNYGTSNSGCQQPQPPCSQQYAACDPANNTVTPVASLDPNDKVGSKGAGVQQYISGATPFRYSVFFANQETASAPAQRVLITDQLDLTNDDLKSFSFGPITFASQLLTPTPLQTRYSTTVDLRPTTNLLVAVSGTLNPSNGLLTWNFQSLDPTTGKPPTDPAVGFLPPGGEGSVFFTVMPKQGLPTNTSIHNQASIVFDVNPAIPTQKWLNTLDNDSPTSQVAALSATTYSPSFQVQWSTSDVGSGVQDATIYASDNGAAFAPWLTNTTASSATYSGQVGHTYAFYSVARDLTGNVEAAKTAAEATTTVSPPIATTIAIGAPSVTYPASANVTVTVTSAMATVTGNVSLTVDSGSPLTQPLSSGAAAFALPVLSAGNHSLGASYAAQGNFAASTATGALTVNQAPLTVTAKNASRVYGEPNPQFTATYSGFVNGDTASVLKGTLTCTTAAASSSPVGAYPVNCSGQTATNYAVTYKPGSLTVNQAPLTVTANNASRAYRAANPQFTVTYAGFVNGDTASALAGTLSCSTTATSSSAIGTYPINCSGETGTNYSIAYQAGTLTVTVASTTATLSAPAIFAGASASATVTVSSATGSPTGNVSLSVDGGAAASQPLSKGTATFSNLTGLAGGSHSLTATYAAQGDFAATSAKGTLDIQDFTLTATTPSMTVTAGSPATYTITVTPEGGFDQTVAFNCPEAAGLTLSSCTASAASITLNGSAAQTVRMMVSTTAGHPCAVSGPSSTTGDPGARWFVLWTLAALTLLWLGGGSRRWALLGATILIAAFLLGCGAGGPPPCTPTPGTSAGTYTVTVVGNFTPTGSVSTLTHSVTLTLKVQ
jgi:hypothetical protein